MIEKKRAGLDLDGFEPKSRDLQQKTQNANLEEIGASLGFVSREPPKHRRKRKSPHQAQANIKCREEIKEIFQEVSYKLGIYDHTTFEKALLALIEKENLESLKMRYFEAIDKIT
ncbi:MAG: hypothetical protein ACRCWR_07380 [Saezia sp.]